MQTQPYNKKINGIKHCLIEFLTTILYAVKLYELVHKITDLKLQKFWKFITMGAIQNISVMEVNNYKYSYFKIF